jgi:hypothetical protein
MSDAKFRINSSASSAGGFDATNGQVLTLQLEASPGLDIETVLYSVSQFTKNAPSLTFSNPSPQPPTTAITVAMPAAGNHTYILRSVINGGVDKLNKKVAAFTHERIVAIRNSLGKRKIPPAETQQYDATFGWTEAFNETIDGAAESPTQVLKFTTTTAVQAELTKDGAAPGASNRIFVPTDSSKLYVVELLARRTDADNEAAAWEFKGGISNNAGTTALDGLVIKTTIHNSNPAAWDADIAADNTNDSLRVLVTGQAGKTISWRANVRLVEITG